MTLEDVKKDKIDDLVIRMRSAMIANYFGGNAISFNNFDANEGYIFSSKEIKYMQTDAEVLDWFRKDGWKITITKSSEVDASEFDYSFTFISTTENDKIS